MKYWRAAGLTYVVSSEKGTVADRVERNSFPYAKLYISFSHSLIFQRYSQIVAGALRAALKGDLRTEALKRAPGTAIKITPWKDGKAIKSEAVA